MLVTAEKNRQNRRLSWLAAGVILVLAIVIALGFGWFRPWSFAALLLGPLVYWLLRRQTVRRWRVLQQPFPPSWDATLFTDVAYFNALSDDDKNRFRQLVQIFLDEVRITGIRTTVDDRCRVLVAASAIIPIFGFPDWEYRLGEVLIYPSSFGHDFGVDDATDRNILGMVGTGHLSGVMLLSKPDLIGGFTNPQDKRNVGIHEFAHLVDKADGAVDGIPPGVPPDVVRPWIQWVGKQLASPPEKGSHINPYAFTNEAEYFAVLTEYLFEAPDVLQRKAPEMYDMLQQMYRQNTKQFLTTAVLKRRRRVGRNAPCPCGSGKKYKKCCRRKQMNR